MWRFLMYLQEWWTMLKPEKFKLTLHREHRLPYVTYDIRWAWHPGAMKWLLMGQLTHYRDAFYMWIVWHLLPKKLIMWAAVRVMAHASQGPWSNEVVGTISMMTMLQRWDKQDFSVNTPGDDGLEHVPTEHTNPSPPEEPPVQTFDGYSIANGLIYIHPVQITAPFIT